MARKWHKYNKYIVFQYDWYDSAGGLEDITGSFKSREDAIIYIEEGAWRSSDHNMIVDRDTWEVIFYKGHYREKEDFVNDRIK